MSRYFTDQMGRRRGPTNNRIVRRPMENPEGELVEVELMEPSMFVEEQDAPGESTYTLLGDMEKPYVVTGRPEMTDDELLKMRRAFER